MKTVLAILPQRGYRDRVRVFLDEGPSLSLTRFTVAERSIAEGKSFSDTDIDDIIAVDTKRTALDTALVFLGHRPRSEAEVRQRLRRSRFSTALIEETMVRLREHGLVDDEAFAQYWVTNRDASHPRSRLALKQELRVKGVEQETVQEAIEGVDEEEGAYRVARKRAPLLGKLEYQEFRRRLGSFLQRHGYRYAVAAKAVALAWEELHGEALHDDEAGDPDADEGSLE